jgi:hypothetical protein
MHFSLEACVMIYYAHSRQNVCPTICFLSSAKIALKTACFCCRSVAIETATPDVSELEVCQLQHSSPAALIRWVAQLGSGASPCDPDHQPCYDRQCYVLTLVHLSGRARGLYIARRLPRSNLRVARRVESFQGKVSRCSSFNKPTTSQPVKR